MDADGREAAAEPKHVCFICLQDDIDDPDAKWIHPSPCSLEGHEECLLRYWIEEERKPGFAKKGLACPICKYPIRVDEPYDAFTALHTKLYRLYSSLSPTVLLGFVAGGVCFTFFTYGRYSAIAFAGSPTVKQWLAQPQTRTSLLWKCVRLAGIGPSLVISRAIPFIGRAFFYPTAILVSLCI